MSKRFYEVKIGQEFHLVNSENTHRLTKVSKGGAEAYGAGYPIGSQALVTLVEEEVSWEELDFHTFDFTDAQRDAVIEEIVQRVKEDYPEKRIDSDRLRKGLYAAHRAKPIRLIALLHSCKADFPTDVILGVYRHYDPKTDSIKNGWTAQHAEPHAPGFLELLFAALSGGNDE